MSQKQILVTGGTGYIGSHTVVELQNQGYDVVIVDDLSNSDKEVIDRIEKISGIRPHFEELNLIDADGVNQLFKKYTKLAAVIHFAAFKAVGESVKEPLKYYQNNLVSLINLLNCMKAYDVPNMVFSSSCTVYGQPETLPVTENAPVQPAESPYGNTKQICEEILRDTVKAYPQLKAIALRYFNPVGAHKTALIGELPKGVPQNLVPFITQTAFGLRDQLSVFGDNYDTIDGSAVRDYIHVVDLAKAHIIAAERLLNGINEENYEYFNLGTGTGSSVLEVINAFEKANGLPVNYKIVDRREGDIEKIWADTTIANEVLGWKAERGLDEMMSSAWAWEKNIREGDC
ncbi:UDP-glucose 4-epimerase GalE [Flammeovirga kamogawensis]|uniref:UDP-glucose 4-epimerase n=1 Tax=Flammeovirga kamogawensis TaxID=373891 RepID=A0ABX8GUE4_9BACT|nr:UDP-glucose 4-epimerase GalE [Flammeovirga kamogawensis]MBB6459755.1 UDP-glucose 4-epimerase [Flammeovirga kamogawensis]QWG07186.1 UDP-glucose 4-epimerase GalE [Flammeovirga kamogawensis]TRX69007.1 UDP-glucose 4-epimerase GalE [Flammeovirga kamogawensis]